MTPRCTEDLALQLCHLSTLALLQRNVSLFEARLRRGATYSIYLAAAQQTARATLAQTYCQLCSAAASWLQRPPVARITSSRIDLILIFELRIHYDTDTHNESSRLLKASDSSSLLGQL